MQKLTDCLVAAVLILMMILAAPSYSRRCRSKLAVSALRRDGAGRKR